MILEVVTLFVNVCVTGSSPRWLEEHTPQGAARVGEPGSVHLGPEREACAQQQAADLVFTSWPSAAVHSASGLARRLLPAAILPLGTLQEVVVPHQLPSVYP